jgi:hypothetical protein
MDDPLIPTCNKCSDLILQMLCATSESRAIAEEANARIRAHENVPDHVWQWWQVAASRWQEAMHEFDAHLGTHVISSRPGTSTPNGSSLSLT